MILLDTHALVWLLWDSSNLGKAARREISISWKTDELCVSAVSFWELGLLTQRKRIQLDAGVPQMRGNLLREGLIEIPVDGHIAVRASELINFRRDPADRLIVATCLEGHRLVTADRKILEWPGKLERIDARA